MPHIRDGEPEKSDRHCPLDIYEDLNWFNPNVVAEELMKEPRHLDKNFNEFSYDCSKRCYDCEYYNCQWIYNRKGTKRRKLTKKETIERVFDGLGKELSALTSPIHDSRIIEPVWNVFFKLKCMITGKGE